MLIVLLTILFAVSLAKKNTVFVSSTAFIFLIYILFMNTKILIGCCVEDVIYPNWQISYKAAISLYEDLKSSCISITWKFEKKNFFSKFCFGNHIWEMTTLWNPRIFKLTSYRVTLNCLGNYLKMLCSSIGVDKDSV